MVQAVIQTTVTGLQGNPVALGVPTANQALTWNGTAWGPGGPFLSTAGGTMTGTIVGYVTPSGQTTPAGIQLGAAVINGSPTGGLVLGTPGNPLVTIQTGGQIATGATGTALNLTAGSANIAGGLSVAGQMNINGMIQAGSEIQAPLFRMMPASSALQSFAPSGSQGGGFLLATAGNGYYYAVTNGPDPVMQWASSQIIMMSLDSGGNLVTHGGITQGSDETTKNTIALYAPGVSVAAQLLPKTFIYNGDATNTPHLGFIAQDVQPILPDAISSTTFKPLTEDGVTTTTLNLDITAIVAVLANAVKQLISRVAALENHDGITPTAAETA
jgi:hypothetical protein